MQPTFVSPKSVSVSGYCWYDSNDYMVLNIGIPGLRRKSAEGQRRMGALPIRETDDFEFRSYDPFKSAPAMFLEFSELDGSEESILKFTNAYGRLWDDFKGPSLVDYREAIDDLREAVSLWLAIQRHDFDAIREHVTWDRGNRLRWKSDLSMPIRQGDKVIRFIDVKKRNRNYKPGDLVGPATDLLDFVISTRPTWDLHIEPVRVGGNLSLQLEVGTLLSVLWVQFAQAVAGAKEFVRCAFCNRPFEVELSRTDRAFCTDNCRVKAYQRRRKQAIALRQQGQSIRQIVKSTGSDLETVKRWLKNVHPKED